MAWPVRPAPARSDRHQLGLTEYGSSGSGSAIPEHAIPAIWPAAAQFRHAEQPALRTLLAPEKRLLVRSGTEGSFTKFINAPYKSECLELYEMMDEYCREPMDLFGTAPALTPPLLELELSQTVSAPPKLGVELGGALSQNELELWSWV
uniref:Uncharacterized protein n=1 Tax=Oryza meridionalis TaxID=40149 RepID=A0A0E0EJ33_9ORYZ